MKAVGRALERFIATADDDERLGLGLTVLEAAYTEARAASLLGWQEQIIEYVEALRDGKGLNRPL